MADVINAEMKDSCESNMDGTQDNGDTAETGGPEHVQEQVMDESGIDQERNGDKPANFFAEWQFAMERGESPFEYMNKYMERLSKMDENEIQKMLEAREQMRKEWAEARAEGRTDEFWKKWTDERGVSQPRFDFGYGPPPEVIKKWMKLKQEGKGRREILSDMFGDRQGFREGFQRYGGRHNRDFSWFDETDSLGNDRETPRSRESDRGYGNERHGRNEGERSGGFWVERGQGVEREDRGFEEERGRGFRSGRGDGDWRFPGRGGWRGRGVGWRGRGWRGRRWDMSAYTVDPDRSYLFQQFHV